MPENSSMARMVIAVTTTLAFVATVSYPATTLAQAQTVQGNPNSSQSGCLSGYPNGTYQGDRSVTRNEFAAGLNACLNQVNQLIPVRRADLATKEDFEVLIQRQRELNAQLRELSGRVGTPPAQKSL